MKRLSTAAPGFAAAFAALQQRADTQSAQVDQAVGDIIADVRARGDAALQAYTRQFDGHEHLVLDPRAVCGAGRLIDADLLQSLETAATRIEAFHRRQLQNSWISTGEQGEIVGQMVRPLERVGLYVPGGKALYPSSVLMNALPARVAGVAQIVMVTPCADGQVDPAILAAAELCGIQEVYCVGGAQAIAALAYGTETIRRVDKIVGPGNIYVAVAKKQVYGDVDIDMIAGPSEILVVADGSGDPAWVAADLLSQAEHDQMAAALLLTTDAGFADAVEAALERQLAQLPKQAIAGCALRDNGAVVVCRDLAEAARLADTVAPEHLELFVADPWQLLPAIHNAGAVFLGHYSPEPVGDYIAGPNHVLPTGGTARFYSPLSVDDYVKKTSLICFNDRALRELGDDVVRLARAEELDAHARAVDLRLQTLRDADR